MNSVAPETHFNLSRRDAVKVFGAAVLVMVGVGGLLMYDGQLGDTANVSTAQRKAVRHPAAPRKPTHSPLVIMTPASPASPRPVAGTGSTPDAQGQQLGLISEQSWSLAGVSSGPSDTLHVAYEGMGIVNQDGSPGQENPAVNLFGTRLAVSGDFSLTATVDLTGYDGEAGFTLYGAPPVIYDEQRYDDRTLRIGFTEDRLRVGLVNGDMGKPATQQQDYTINKNAVTTINVLRHGGRLAFGIVTGQDAAGKNIVQTLGSIPETGLLDHGQLWFGLDAASPGGWTLTDATVTPLNGGQVGVVDTSRLAPTVKAFDGLNTLAERRRPGFKIGAAMALGPIVSDLGYASLMLGGNFGSMTPENAMKFQFIHPQPNSYTFEEADALVAIARANGLVIHGHTLDFAEANPAWVQDIAKNHPEQLKTVLQDHIKTVMQHFGGKVADWDVVNEPLADYDTTPGEFGLRNSIWYKAMGPDHVAIALRAAHDANPSSRLWINEFGLESDDDRFATMVALVKRLQAANVPLYGIGFQSHIDEGDTTVNDSSIDTEKLRSRIRTLAALGIKARISELDVSTATEQGVFADVLETCISEPNCTGVTMWGATDKYGSSGGVDNQGKRELGTGLPWDAQLRPLSSVNEMKQRLTK